MFGYMGSFKMVLGPTSSATLPTEQRAFVSIRCDARENQGKLVGQERHERCHYYRQSCSCEASACFHSRETK
jgi:hypothetical protein